MTATTKEHQEKVHTLVDDAILSSITKSPASTGEIADKTKQQKTLVARRFAVLGFVWNGKRWVYRHNEATHE